MMGVLLLAAAAVTNVVSNVAELKAVVPKLKWGSTLVLKDGVYDLSSLSVPAKDPTFLHCKAKVTIRSSSGDPAKCVLLGPGEAKPGRCLAFDGGDSRLVGITVSNFFVKGSSAAVHPGVWSDSTWFTNCVFAACRATDRGGAICRAAAPGGRVTCDDCTFVDCVSEASGGALASLATVVANGCRFIRCQARNGDGGAGSHITATGCRFTECSAKGRGGAGGGAAVSFGETRDCVFERCVDRGYAILRNSRAVHCAFVDCVGSSGFQHRFEDCCFKRSGGVSNSTLVNCKLDACSYPTNDVASLISFCTLTNCTIARTTGGNPKRWNSGMLNRSTLVNCLVAGNRSARDEVRDPAHPDWNCVFENTLITKESEAEAAKKAQGRGWDPASIKRRIAAQRAAQEAKLAAECKSGVHELLRIDFDNEKPRAKGCYGGFWCGIWGASKCEFSLVPGEGGKGEAMRCNLKGMVGGQLQVSSQPWVMWQNTWYRLRFKARGVDHPGQVSVGVRKYGYPWSMLAWPFKVFHPENEWKEYVIYKKSQHDVSGGFGIMLALGDVGCVDFDYFIVEKLDYDPTEKEAPENPNPPVRGNLIPRGSFETIGDPFFILNRSSSGIWTTWYEPWMERVEGGHDGKYCMHFPPLSKCPKEVLPGKARLTSARTLRSVRIPVASGHKYKLSGWYKLTGAPGDKFPTAYCYFSFNSEVNGKGWGGGNRFCITEHNRRTSGKNTGAVPGEWQRLEVVSAKPVPKNVRSVVISIEINGYDICLDGLDFRMVGDDLKPSEDPAEKPYELQAAFDSGDPRTTPRIVKWGERLPLSLAAMPKSKGEGEAVKVTLKVVAYPDKVTATEKLTLKTGEAKRVDVDPGANGILRVELSTDDAQLADPLEVVMARLPEPRKTGPESFFGSHIRMCPYFVNYAAAIGLKWQRLHDCSNMCKMKWANPEPGVYQWADEIVDYVRSKGINILALPDYPSAYIMPTNALGQVVYDNEGYKAWCCELAKHYKGRIDHFEIWNEPYMPYFYKRDAKEYGKTFNAGAEGIRKGNPSAKVIGWCTEFTTPKYVTPFLKDYPVENKPDYNSVHYYYNSIPGDGDLSYERIVRNVKDTFGERAGSELWNTEGNLALTHTFYTKMRAFSRSSADRGVAFGTRGWAETVANGISKTFLYTMHNTDNVDVGGLMTLIDYDRAPTPEAAATAVTAYFIDGLKPVKDLPGIERCKYQIFAGQGRASLLLWDDVLKEGRARIDTSKLAAVYDAMGNRLTGKVELTMVPVFVTDESDDAAGLVGRTKASLE